MASHLLERYYKPVLIIAAGKAASARRRASRRWRRLTPRRRTWSGLVGTARRRVSHCQRELPPLRRGDPALRAEQPPPVRTLQADALLAPDDIGSDLLEAIHRLEPYGEGHRAPVFVVTERLEMARAVGREKTTLQFRVAGIKGVAWRQGALADSLRRARR